MKTKAAARATQTLTGARLRALRYWARLNFTGIVFALIFFCFSMLPSLLPRPWVFQAVVSGVSLAVGYGIGTLISAAIRWSINDEIRLPEKVRFWAWRLLAFIGPLAAIGYFYFGAVWQENVRTLVGEEPLGNRYYIRTAFLTVLIAIVLIALARAVRWATGKLTLLLDDYLPRRLSIALGIAVAIGLGWWLLSGVFYNFFVTTTNQIYASQNDKTPDSAIQPQVSTRSGGPGSLIPWGTLGYQGRAFTGRGPTAEMITRFNGTPAIEPIRVYAGLESADSATSRAALAVKELQRTHAFDRKVLVLATTTGTGWLEPQSVDSIEYMYGGDSAIVTQQYSYLPSWISFLVDTQNARDAGRALFDAVYAEWSKQPIENRPKLIAYGLSLGSFGGQAAYSGVNDMQRSLDGALFVGTPNETELWRSITADRQPGSPEWQPTFDRSRAVRFAATNDDIASNGSDWKHPRILYLQHASDPVVWFNFNLLFHEPDWLKEPRGPDVASQTRWYPVVTFLQVAIDQFFGTTVPNGHGHNYANTIVEAWQAVASPPDWNSGDSAKLQALIDSYANE